MVNNVQVTLNVQRIIKQFFEIRQSHSGGYSRQLCKPKTQLRVKKLLSIPTPPPPPTLSADEAM